MPVRAGRDLTNAAGLVMAGNPFTNVCGFSPHLLVNSIHQQLQFEQKFYSYRKFWRAIFCFNVPH